MYSYQITNIKTKEVVTKQAKTPIEAIMQLLQNTVEPCDYANALYCVENTGKRHTVSFYKLKQYSNQELLAAYKNFDLTMYQKYYPNIALDDSLFKGFTEIYQYINFILADVEQIILEKGLNQVKYLYDYEMAFCKRYNQCPFIDFDKIQKSVKVRMDWEHTLDTMHYYDAVSSVGYSFYSSDLKQLALMYKARKKQKTIENLLNAANYRHVINDFRNKEFDKYIVQKKI